MAKRYFEFKDAKSHKFWEVSVSAKKVNIRYGKVGTDGQTSVKELGTPAEAKAHAEKQAAGKVKKGYKEAKAKAVKKVAKKAVKKKSTKKKAAKKKAMNKAKSLLTKAQIKELKDAEEAAEDSYDFKSVADDIAEAGDKDWAKKIYEKSEENSDDCSDFKDLADSIHENLEDKEWAKKIYKKAEEKAENSREFCSLADSINEKLCNNEKAKKLYKKAEKKAEDSDDFCSLADSIHENLGDKEWAKKVYKKAEKKAKDSDDFCSLADSIHENLGDKEWAKKIYKKADGKAKDCDHLISLAESIIEKISDKEWAARLYKKAIDTIESAEEWWDEFPNLADSIYENTKNKKLLKQLCIKWEEKGKEYTEFCSAEDTYNDLASRLRKLLGDQEWADKISTYFRRSLNGQDVLDFIEDRYFVDDLLEITDADSTLDEENRRDTWKVRVSKKWRVDVIYSYKDRGGDNPFPDSPRWDCNSQEVIFFGDGNDFKKWLQKNWKKVYEGYSWSEDVDDEKKVKKKSMR